LAVNHQPKPKEKEQGGKRSRGGRGAGGEEEQGGKVLSM